MLVQWLSDLRGKGTTVSSELIKVEAKKLFSGVYPDSAAGQFSASNGWLQKFLRRQQFTVRWVTSTRQKIPDNARELAENYLSYLQETVAKYGINPTTNIGNMDETLCGSICSYYL